MIELKKSEEAYTAFPGPILVLAGPGTGKTYQLAHRVKWLIENRNASPSEIAVITFTNEAARNMRERLAEKDAKTDEPFLPRESHPKLISTMNSLGNRIIGETPALVGLPEKYNVLHDKHLRDILLGDAAVLAGFDRSKAESLDDYRREGRDLAKAPEDLKAIDKKYIEILRKCALVDFDDQILLACQILRDSPNTLESWKSRARYLLVDEYQDINRPQFDMISLLTENQEDGLFAVGDDDQSIYSFRGGSAQYIRGFTQSFGQNAKVCPLAVSRRCSEHILMGARSIVSSHCKNRAEKPEPTFTFKTKGGEKIFFWEVPSDAKESEIIARIAKKSIESSSVNVMIPHGKYLPPIKKALTKERIDFKYKLALHDKGLVRFSVLARWCRDRSNSAKLRQLIDLMINNYDDLTAQLPAETKKITELRKLASNSIASLWNNVSRKCSLFDVLERKAKEPNPNRFLFGLYDNLRQTYQLLENSGGKRSTLPGFLKTCGLFVAPGENPRRILAEVEDWENELRAASKATPHEPVLIFNMPSSKGLEADVVCVVGVTEGILPDSKKDIEEQARLLYVAMTRAKRELHLFSARTRSATTTFKKDSYQMERSHFVDSIPQEHIEVRLRFSKSIKKKKAKQATVIMH